MDEITKKNNYLINKIKNFEEGIILKIKCKTRI
jgi:hypothetical protein